MTITDAKCSFNKLSLIKKAVKLIYQHNKVPFEGRLFQLFKLFIFPTGCIFLYNWVKKINLYRIIIFLNERKSAKVNFIEKICKSLVIAQFFFSNTIFQNPFCT